MGGNVIMPRLRKSLAVAFLLGLITSLLTLVPIQAATPSVLINGGISASGAVGSTQTLVGNGFTPGETVTIQFGTAAITTTPSVITAGVIGGGWTATIVIPAAPSDSAYAITAVGSVSATPVGVVFSITPTITVNPTSGLPGAPVTVTGTGFGSLETNITTKFDNVTTVGSPQTATTLGGWSVTFNVPSIAAGVHTIHAAGAKGIDTTCSFTVIALPKITLNTSAGIVGNPVTISGTAFAAGETGIVVSFGNTQINGTTAANGNGAWTMQFNVPNVAGGT